MMEDLLKEHIEKTLNELGIVQVDFTVEHPADLSHGDYASNVAMEVLANERKPAKQKLSELFSEEELKDVSRIVKLPSKNPHELAEQIVKKLEGQIESIEKIKIADPGFINFFLKRDFFKEKIAEANKRGNNWGKNDSWKGKKVMVEYTDPNPFKEFHIGHLFTNSVGEAIARLFMMAGADTKRANYQGDVGMHVANAVWGLKQMQADVKNLDAKTLGKAYALGTTAYKESESAKKEITDINRKIYEKSDEEINALYDAGRKTSLEYFESIYKLLGTKFDYYFFESETAPFGKELVEQNPDVFTESDGAYVFEGEKYGLHTRVFLNSEGLPTYEAKELALAKMKEKAFPYDLSVISTSNEINEYFKVLKKAMSFIYPELEAKTEHIGHGTVRLAGSKMSSRTGNIISALDFIDEIAEAVSEKMKKNELVGEIHNALAQSIAIGAIKYTTLRSNISLDSIFDKEQALSFEGDSGPYLQYTHARIVSVLEKARELHIAPDISAAPPTPYVVEKILYRFPEIILAALNERKPHQIIVYLTELASEFNTFYAKEKIADKDDEYAPYKVAVADAVRQTLKNGLWTLGIEAPERM